MPHIIDTETASLQGGICELAVLEIDNDLNVVREQHTRVNPERAIEPGAFAAHGIEDWQVETCHPISVVAQTFGLAKVGYAIGHNVGFDLRMLKGHINPSHSLCTLALARQYIKGTTNHKLETLKRELGFPDQKSHSALGDVYTTLDLLRHVRDLAGVDLPTLFERASAPKIVHRITFGTHKGKLVTSLPVDYRNWLLAQEGLESNLRYTLERLK